MSRNESGQKLSVLAIIAVILGAVAVGLGGLNMLSASTEGPKGTDGDDGTNGIDGIDGVNGTDGTNGDPAPGYYCSSGAEVQNAIDTIGTGTGTIMITNNITLTTQIVVDQGGNYLIRGDGMITVDCGANRAFFITNAKTCIIRDLKINATNVGASTDIILVMEDNPIYIQNVHIEGAGNGHGVSIVSKNAWVQDCFMINLKWGIYLSLNSESCHILNNIMTKYMEYGIYVLGSYNTISGNIIRDINTSTVAFRGIYLDGADCNTISDNTFFNITTTSGNIYIIYGADINFNTISGNLFSNHSSSAGDIRGIYLLSSSDHNTINGNIIRNFEASGTNYAIYIGDGRYTTICSNTIKSILADSACVGIDLALANFSAVSCNTLEEFTSTTSNSYGILLTTSCNNSTVTGNTITSISAPSAAGYGIFLSGGYNTIIGNTISEFETFGISNSGLNNVVEHNIW